MHRHAYAGRKLSRAMDQREALVRGQITSLVLYEKIETTVAKAKEVAPQFDRLVTKAKRGTLADQRAIRREITSELAVQKLMRELIPAMADRKSGYTRIVKTGSRRGDNASMAVLALITSKPAKAEKEVTKDKSEPKQADKKSPKPSDRLQPETKQSAPVKEVQNVAKRAGRRGDK